MAVMIPNTKLGERVNCIDNLTHMSVVFRDSAMAAAADCSYQEREGLGGVVPAHLPGHHRPQATHRDRGHQGR